jgi:excisionase family DNA binding protein
MHMSPDRREREMPTTHGRRLVDIDGAADRLGVPVRHVRRLVAERRIPYIKWGSRLHFDPDEIDAWIEQHRVPSSDLA